MCNCTPINEFCRAITCLNWWPNYDRLLQPRASQKPNVHEIDYPHTWASSGAALHHPLPRALALSGQNGVPLQSNNKQCEGHSYRMYTMFTFPLPGAKSRMRKTQSGKMDTDILSPLHYISITKVTLQRIYLA